MGSKKLLGLIHWVKSFNKRAGNIFSPIDSYCWWKKILHRTSWHGESLSFVRLSTKNSNTADFNCVCFPSIFNPTTNLPKPSHPTFFQPSPPTNLNPTNPNPSNYTVHIWLIFPACWSLIPLTNQPPQPTTHPTNQQFQPSPQPKKIPLAGLRYIRPPVLSHWSVRNTLPVDFQKPKTGSVMAWDGEKPSGTKSPYKVYKYVIGNRFPHGGFSHGWFLMVIVVKL